MSISPETVWFAWRPVRLMGGGWAWLKKVKRFRPLNAFNEYHPIKPRDWETFEEFQVRRGEATSILSKFPDGMGYHYALEPNGYRQINVRRGPVDILWRAYVGGERVGDVYETKEAAESAAISWAKANPEKGDEG